MMTLVQKHVYKFSIVVNIVFHCGITKTTDFLKWDFNELTTQNGYIAEEYLVTTEDGYILTLFRFPGKSTFPVLLVHGLMDSADTWLLRGNNSLGISLANDGYDVWLGNTRGNRYSRRHKYLNPDNDNDFWNFSFHEVGVYDLPAIIDKILSETGAEKVTAIGHSQGNTAFLVLGSTRPEYNQKINVMIALAPICYLSNSSFPLSLYILISSALEKTFKLLGIREIFGDNSCLTALMRHICSMPIIGYTVCGLMISFPLIGYDVTELEPIFYPTLVAHFPAGTSSMSILHYLQVGRRGEFAQYDFGAKMNEAVYISSTPPLYNLSKVTMPYAIFAAKNDPLSTVPNVNRLRRQLPNVAYYLLNPRCRFNHVDSVWGKRMHSYIFPYIHQVLRLYN